MSLSSCANSATTPAMASATGTSHWPSLLSHSSACDSVIVDKELQKEWATWPPRKTTADWRKPDCGVAIGLAARLSHHCCHVRCSPAQTSPVATARPKHPLKHESVSDSEADFSSLTAAQTSPVASVGSSDSEASTTAGHGGPAKSANVY